MVLQLVGLSLIYPIVLDAKLRIHDTIVIFTKIYQRDIDLYTTHYKQLQFAIANSNDN